MVRYPFRPSFLALCLALSVAACSAEPTAAEGTVGPGGAGSGGQSQSGSGGGGSSGSGGSVAGGGAGGQGADGGSNAGAGASSGAGGSSGTAASGSGGSGGAGGASGVGGGTAGGTAGDTGGGIPVSGDCDLDLVLTIRDFQSSHPDFESFMWFAVMPDLVAPDLGADHKPVYANPAGTFVTTGPAEFGQWYNDVPGVNQRVEVTVTLTEQSPGLFVYDNSAFFPVDGQGFGDEGNGHNFHFTTEIHTEFAYRGGEVFTFTGDDDLYLFINDKFALDLGGVHPSVSGTVDLDAQASALGISPGKTYPMDIFHAERHTTASNFRIETTIECIKVVVLE